MLKNNVSHKCFVSFDPFSFPAFLRFLFAVAILAAVVVADDAKKEKDDNKNNDGGWLSFGNIQDYWLNLISFCPDADNCGFLEYSMKDCDKCETKCTFEVYSSRVKGFVCESQSFCDCSITEAPSE